MAPKPIMGCQILFLFLHLPLKVGQNIEKLEIPSVISVIDTTQREYCTSFMLRLKHIKKQVKKFYKSIFCLVFESEWLKTKYFFIHM